MLHLKFRAFFQKSVILPSLNNYLKSKIKKHTFENVSHVIITRNKRVETCFKQV
jgi:hypothetical protein